MPSNSFDILFRGGVFNFSLAYQLFVSWMMSFVLYLTRHRDTRAQWGFLLAYLLRVLVFHFAFMSMTHFELIFVKGIRPASGFTFHMWMSICWGDYLCSVVSPSLLCPHLHFNGSLWLPGVEGQEPLRRTVPCPVTSSWLRGRSTVGFQKEGRCAMIWLLAPGLPGWVSCTK